MRRNFKIFITISVLGLIGVSLVSLPVKAEESVADQVNLLTDEITARQARLDELDARLDKYSDAIRQKEAEARTLNNELGIMDNKIAKLQLDVESTKLQIDKTEDEVQLLDLQIGEETQQAERERTMLASVLRQMQQSQGVNALEMVFSHRHFSEVIDELSRLESVHTELHQVLDETKQLKESLQTKKASKESKLQDLQSFEESLNKEKGALSDSVDSKELLLGATQSSEAQYQELVQELKEEEAYVESQVQSLQKQVDQKILDSDGNVSGVPIINWPVSDFVITTLFHDPTYPFRNLFEHSGIDLAVPSGTAVHAAAPGYVAFAKTGRMYGNYVMIVHGSGLATLYAHLSKMNVKADDFVGRGDVIGLSGSTGFSTGPHVHFEVRLDGIPVDPMGYVLQ